MGIIKEKCQERSTKTKVPSSSLIPTATNTERKLRSQ